MNRLVVQARLFSPGRLGVYPRRSLANASKTADFADEEKSTTTTTADEVVSIVPDVEESILREQQMREKIERMRDVSRFSKVSSEWKHRNQLPDLTKLKSGDEKLNDPRHYRKMYAKFGRASGIEPGVAWPSTQRLEKIIADEKEFDLTLDKKIQILIERKTAEFEKHQKL